MDYNKATLHAATGRTLLLPGWRGYFYWDYSKKELNFRNGDYHQIINSLEKRESWRELIGTILYNKIGEPRDQVRLFLFNIILCIISTSDSIYTILPPRFI